MCILLIPSLHAGSRGAYLHLTIKKIEAQRGEGSQVSLIRPLFLNTMLASILATALVRCILCLGGPHPCSLYPHLISCFLPEHPGAGPEAGLIGAGFTCQLPTRHRLAAPMEEPLIEAGGRGPLPQLAASFDKE